MDGLYEKVFVPTIICGKGMSHLNPDMLLHGWSKWSV
jgi:hypothetical protein